jgi:hypothetical protein
MHAHALKRPPNVRNPHPPTHPQDRYRRQLGDMLARQADWLKQIEIETQRTRDADLRATKLEAQVYYLRELWETGGSLPAAPAVQAAVV